MAKDGQLCNPLRLDFLRGTTQRATRTLPHMHTLRTTLALLALASCAAFAAPSEIAGVIVEHLKAPVSVHSAPLTKADLPAGGDKATVESRLARAQDNWRRFILQKTTETDRPNRRAFPEFGYWDAFTGSSFDDLTLQVLDKRTRALEQLEQKARGAVRLAEMEPDSPARTQLMQAADELSKAIAVWRSSGGQSHRSTMRSAIAKIVSIGATAPKIEAEAAK